MKVRLAADLAEGQPRDEDLWSLIDLPILCLGAHAGNLELTKWWMSRAKEATKSFALHPGYPDPANFGRNPMDWDDGQVRSGLIQSLSDQIQLGAGAVALKPHGAFFHQTVEPGRAADHLVEMLRSGGWPLIGWPGSFHEQIASEAGVDFWAEGYLDRQVGSDGHLVPRSQPGALIHDPERAWEIYEELSPHRRVLTVHSDSPAGVEILEYVRSRR